MNNHNWIDQFSDTDIFFVTPDVKRGAGLSGVLANYHVICSYYEPIIPALRKQGAKIFCLEEKQKKGEKLITNSGQLLAHPQVLAYIKKLSRATASIAFFKPSLKMDFLIKKYGFQKIGNDSSLNEIFENKVTSALLTQKILPQASVPFVYGVLGELDYATVSDKLGSSFVVQFSHGWAGKTTYFIDNKKQFDDLRQKFLNTRVKAGKKIQGITVLNNCCIYRDQILISPAAIQLDRIQMLSTNPAATCGRQWPVNLALEQLKTINYYSQIVARLMKSHGFRGYFGLDFLVETSSGRVYLSEINARMTASASFYTRLELGCGLVPLFTYHLASFIGKNIPVSNTQTPKIVGAQIVFRREKFQPKIDPKIDYGLFMRSGDKILYKGESYNPETISLREFIFIRKKSSGQVDSELSRIECKEKIIDKEHQLKSWLIKLLKTD